MSIHALQKEVRVEATAARAAVIGLGSMGFGVAQSLKRAGSR